MKPLISIADALTGQTVVREMTDEEFERYEKDNARIEAMVAQREQEIENKKIEKQQVLDRLGITEEEAKLLLG
jgi:hypothetical protein